MEIRAISAKAPKRTSMTSLRRFRETTGYHSIGILRSAKCSNGHSRISRQAASEMLCAVSPTSLRFYPVTFRDRKSTRLNSSHVEISYAVFCLKKKKKKTESSPYLKTQITKLSI